MNTNPAGRKKTYRQDPAADRSAAADKWGSALTAGFQIIPSVLIRAQNQLGLDAVDCVVLLNLTLHWWKKDALPYPPPALIARRMGVSRRTIERRLLRLQEAGWLERLPAEGIDGQLVVRKYDLSGMVRRLQHAAIIGLHQRDYQRRLKSRQSAQGKLPSSGGREPFLLGSGT